MVKTRLQNQQSITPSKDGVKVKRKRTHKVAAIGMEIESAETEEDKSSEAAEETTDNAQEKEDITENVSASFVALEEDESATEQSSDLKNATNWGKIDFWDEIEHMAEVPKEDAVDGTIGGDVETNAPMETKVESLEEKVIENGAIQNGSPPKVDQSPFKRPPLTPTSILRKAASPSAGASGKKARRVQFKEDELAPDKTHFSRSFHPSPYPKRLLEPLVQSIAESSVNSSAESPAKQPMKAFGQMWPIGRATAATPTRWYKSARKLLPIQEKASPCEVADTVQKQQQTTDSDGISEAFDAIEQNLDDTLSQVTAGEEGEQLRSTDIEQPMEMVVPKLVSLSPQPTVVEQEETENEHRHKEATTNELPSESFSIGGASERTTNCFSDQFDGRSDNEQKRQRATDTKTDVLVRIKKHLDKQHDTLRQQMGAMLEQSMERMLDIVAEELAAVGEGSVDVGATGSISAGNL